MNDIQAVINKCIEVLSYQLHFGSISFSMLQFWLAELVFILLVWFIKKLIDS